MTKKRRTKRGAGPPPDPLIVSPSDEFIGNDGPWSAFNVRLGTPPQLMKMIASTSSSEIWAVNAKGCGQHDPKECVSDRGGLFNTTGSTSWQKFANESRSPLEVDRELPYHGNATYGYEVVNYIGRPHGTDPQGITIKHQVVAQISSKEYYTSFLGLNPKPLSANGDRPGHSSNLRDMKDQGYIPSLSYGFTAGARNRRQGASARQARANLVLGGYDASLRKPNDVDFKMTPGDTERDLSVWVKSMNFLGNATDANVRTAITSTPFVAVVDSGVSPFFLPPGICEAFANYLQIKYNSTIGTYLINEAQHNRLENDSPALEVTISPQAVGGKDVTIQIPFASLELRMTKEYPNAPTWSRYFPIRPTDDPAQFTLGRVFLQEAYLIANYESRNFSVAQREYETDNPVIVPIADPSRPATDDVSNSATYGLIAGGCALAGLLILLLVWRCHRRRGHKKDVESASGAKTELDSTSRTIYELDKGNEVFELTGKPSRVEAINPDMKCAYDEEVQHHENIGPFELPANEEVESPTLTTRDRSQSDTAADPDELISPIEGTVSSASGIYTVSTFQTISPITPTDGGLEPIEERPLVPRPEENREEKR